MAHISRAHASFRIGGDRFTDPPGALPDAKAVTARLGIQPTYSHSPGERRSAKAAPYKHGQWRLESPLAESEVLEVHLRWLLDRLLPVREGVLEIVQTDRRLSADFFCGLYLKQGNEGLVLSPRTLEEMSALNAELDLDIYWIGSDLNDPRGRI